MTGEPAQNAPSVPGPCLRCGWQYPQADLDACARGDLLLDPLPTHRCQAPALTAPTPEVPPVDCAWCGRAIALAPDGVTWLAVKAAERGYEPAFCEAVADGYHDPLDEETTDG